MFFVVSTSLLPRMIKLPRQDHRQDYVYLSRLIGHHLADIFPGTKLLGYWPFRVTRNSELYIDEEETANLKKLAKTYAAMSPEGAASILKQMEDDQNVKILVFIKEGDSAPILEAFAKSGEADAKRVAMISERVRVASFRNQILKTTAP